MIKQIGTKIYYCNITGNVIKIIGDMQGYVKETNFDEDYLIYQELNEREKETIGLIEIEFGQYLVLSKDSTGVMVNLETKELIFTYEPMPVPPPEPTWEEQVNNKISILQEENKKLKESQTQQDADILVTQEAVDFLMLSNMPMAMNLNNNIKLGGNNMAAYIATRIIKKGNISIEAGRDYYITFLTHPNYAQHKAEVDLILKAEGKEELIVDLTNM